MSSYYPFSMHFNRRQRAGSCAIIRQRFIWDIFGIVLGSAVAKLRAGIILLIFCCYSGHATGNEGPEKAAAKECKRLLDKGRTFYNSGNLTGALEYATKAEGLAKRYQLEEQQVSVQLQLGNINASLSNFGEAMGNFKEALNTARKFPLLEENGLVAANNIGRLYYYEGDFKRALEYFKNVYEKSAGKNYKIGPLAGINISLAYNMLNNPKMARQYLKETRSLPKSKELATTWVVVNAEALFLEGRLKEAEKEMAGVVNKFENGLKLDPNVGREGYINAVELLSKILGKQQKPDLAIIYANKGVQISGTMTNRQYFYEMLSGFYVQKNDLDTASKYKDSVIIAKDSMASLINRGLFETNKVKLRVQEYQSEIKHNSEIYDSERKLLYSIIIAIVALVTGVILVFRQRKIAADRNRQLAMLELEKEKNENYILERKIIDQEIQAQIEEEYLKEEIQARNRKLSAKALYLSGRNALIEEVVTAIAESPKLSKVPSLLNHVKELKEHLQSDHEWDSFITHFEEVNPGFINRLKQKHPSFTPQDVRFIIYLYMNLSLKEIASMLNITYDSCRKRKERIALKMNLPDSTRLYHYISTI